MEDSLKNCSECFFSKFQKPPHFYPTRFSELNYVQPVHSIKTRKYSISIRRPYIWNSFLSPEEKQYYA